MVLVESTMLELGTPAPTFTLSDVISGKKIGLVSFTEKKALLVMFICNHCPYVQHIQSELAKLGRDYKTSALAIVAISANDAENYPDDSPEKLKEQAQQAGFLFPYLYDDTQRTAKAYTASCTPDFFLFDQDRRLAYRGQFDDSRPGNDIPVTGKDLRAAIDAVLTNRPVSPMQNPSIGCNIKWKEYNAPRYFNK